MRSCSKFEGPYGRYYRALFDIEHEDAVHSTDPWVTKLVEILRVAKYYANMKKDGQVKFMQECPLYYELYTTFKENKAGSYKEMLEASLLATADYTEIERALNIPQFNRLFIGLYQELFYHVSDMRGNQAMFMRYILRPILNENSSKIAIGAIWKLIASAGGMNALMSKGFGCTAIHPEDISYILQLCSMRNCSVLMQYASMGTEMWEDNQNNVALIDKLATFDTIRGQGRSADGFAKLTGISRNAFSDMLSAGIKLISLPKDLSEEVYRLDGTFHPELEVSVERVENNPTKE